MFILIIRIYFKFQTIIDQNVQKNSLLQNMLKANYFN